MSATVPILDPPPGWAFNIPDWKPASINPFLGRGVGKSRALTRAKQTTCGIIKVYAMKVGLRFVSDAYRPRRCITLRVTQSGPGGLLDPDNIQKIFLDGCKMARLIVDDSAEWLEFPRPHIERGPRTNTFLLVEDMP